MLYFGYFTIFALTLAATLMLEHLLIPRLRKSAAQPIYGEGPAWHMSKSGTPTMGGIGFIVPILTVGGICSALLYLTGESYSATSLAIALAYGAINALIGVTDDLSKIKRKTKNVAEKTRISKKKLIYLKLNKLFSFYNY